MKIFLFPKGRIPALCGIPIILVAYSLTLFSCGSDVSKDGNSQNQFNIPKIISKAPAAIQVNQSTVTAVVDAITIKAKDDFQVKANILKVENTPAYHSMAIEGAAYTLTPNFQLDDKKQIMLTLKNTGLMNLAKLKSGDTFKAIIFYTQFKGWFIDSVLSSSASK
ncbi:MAG: hypothetical protein ACYCVH_10090 [Ignavibacteriaceae bacterium]